MADDATRTEHDFLGYKELPAHLLYGIHTLRALDNFPLSGRPLPEVMVRAFGMVKWASAATNLDLGVWQESPGKAAAIIDACREMAEGKLTKHVVVDPLQGGAGTSMNMNVNEVIANRALELLGLPYGRYDVVSPIGDINLHQSTNDTYPTALRLAAIWSLRRLEDEVLKLQESFQDAEKRLAHIVKVGRTEMQDAVLITLGREMAAYAEAFNRDRWRLFKCEERLRVVNLGGTAIGTGLTAPRRYIFRVVDKFRELTGIGFARAENLVDATQNADVFAEVMGMVKALAVSLHKVCGDLRLLSSGPDAGLGEISLPARQAGSSIMPGKVNPVIPEAVSQSAMLVFGYDSSLTFACASGSLELNPFMPLIAHCLLDSVTLMERSCRILRELCVDGITADEDRCRKQLERSTVVATALIPHVGYEKACDVLKRAEAEGKTIRQIVVEWGLLTEAAFDRAISPEAVCRLGHENNSD
ncbi:MAG TPA: aspartate ammonia-lyase [Dissulfurispiraceae bacterium]|nr:aspartate ammonia-lyase [Dissulfurispiraceae bacterium]